MPGLLAAAGAVTALVASALGATPQSEPTPVEAPTELRVNIEGVNGSGCPAGTTAVSVAPDRTSFTVTYSDYLAQVGLGADPADFRKNCQLNLSVDVPDGFTYAIFGLDYRGYAHLADGASGLQQATHYFQGSTNDVVVSREFEGPYDDDWQVSDDDLGALVWAPCGEQRNVNINTELRVDSGSSGGSAVSFLAMESTNVPAATFHLTWKRC
ncbi:DUF4360 domain-containing protein [Streptomyces sp. B6B3]|uniref:DUF4360 domain-containing protein n=1 Tax=Streptomyces sp. B6B3 TaxID=3153570 RepID=UPI00325F7FD2